MNKIWRDAKLRGAGMKRAKTLVSAAGYSIGSKEAPEAPAVCAVRGGSDPDWEEYGVPGNTQLLQDLQSELPEEHAKQKTK